MKSSGDSKRWLPYLIGVPVAIVLAVVGSQAIVSVLRPHIYSGTVIRGDTPAPTMEDLQFVSGDAVDLGSFDDSDAVVLVFFGYTNCPDICPTTLSAVSKARNQLSEQDQERTQVLMVSVDPERDKPDRLQEYVEFFDPSFLSAGGSEDQIARVASLYGVHYELGEGTVEEGYLVDHTATLLGIGSDGVLRVVWPPDIDAAALADDLEELLS